ncbi:hypothetical protein NLI96_g11680 [Meripilus lineatus]|uniref:Uncharacterized protein n=1 Tax=Meripilus lineatus TaxID=2056292 RepID=A0AAD5URF3_9APHY|nr:hypothetical protein NLI96_g11680 [Physisporinus lineatus]
MADPSTAESGPAIVPRPSGEAETGDKTSAAQLFDERINSDGEGDGIDRFMDDAVQDIPPKVLRTNKPTKELHLPDKMFVLPEQTEEMISNRDFQLMLPIAKKKSALGRTTHQYSSLRRKIKYAKKNEKAQLRAKQHVMEIQEISRVEDLWRGFTVSTHAAEVAEKGSSDAALDVEAMAAAIKKQVHGIKDPIRRRPPAGASRTNEKQKIGQAVALRASEFRRLAAGFEKVKCHSGKCQRQKECASGDIVCCREYVPSNPEALSLELLDTHYKYTHWQCLTPASLNMLKLNPTRYSFHTTISTHACQKIQALISGKRARKEEDQLTAEEIKRRDAAAIRARAKTCQRREADYSVTYKDKRGARYDAMMARKGDIANGKATGQTAGGTHDEELMSAQR